MARLLNTDSEEMRYLLGTLDEAGRDRLEERYFGNNADFEELEIAEEELIDAYARGQLSKEDQKLFEARASKSPALIERVRFAQLLEKKTTSREAAVAGEESREVARSPARVSWWQNLFTQPAYGFAFTAVAVLLLIGSAVLFGAWLRLSRTVDQLAREKARLEQETQQLKQTAADRQKQNDQLTADLQTERNQSDADRALLEEIEHTSQQRGPAPSLIGSIVSTFLLPGSSRGGSVKDVAISSSVSRVQLKLGLETNDYQNYRVAIKDAAGATVYQQGSLKTQQTKLGPVVRVLVPSRRLDSGDYLVILSGRSTSGQFADVSDYRFRVVKT